ncbi:oligomeric golgi complex component, COG2-domain-containing protein [Lipomyces orientalis]|uniref:Oligomeric golgi complex component, COG2-domain-containing protein n=1 Tax=Lipomyces orientalis TaxID=1233043 RepID=A0ACC3TLG7_9ASCO
MAQDESNNYFSRHTALSANGNSRIRDSPPGMTPEYSTIEDDMLFDGDEADFDANGLPYPKPIQRSSFSAPVHFDPDSFLVSQHRYQRLEDLHRQLTDWSSVLQKELVELINRDYADFVGLGKSVSGGSGKVDDMKLVVIGFRREVEGISSRLKSVIEEMDELLQRKRTLREKENLGRSLISYALGLQALEIALHIDSSSAADSTGLEDTYPTPASRLKSLTAQYHSARQRLKNLPKNHPFVVAQDCRIGRIRKELIEEIKCQQNREARIELLSCLTGIVNEDRHRQAVR